jgi:hypothetical protein
MKTRSESASSTAARRGFVVGAHQAISLRPHARSELRILGGEAWITLNRTRARQGVDDLFLRSGEALAVPAGAHLVMEPRSSGQALRFDWTELPPCQALARPKRFENEVVAPSRELAQALTQAVWALARLVRGVAGYGEFLIAGRGRVLSRFESNPP